MLKTSGFALGFQHLPRDIANINEWKIMFDPYIYLSPISVKTFQFIPSLNHVAIFFAPIKFLVLFRCLCPVQKHGGQ